MMMISIMMVKMMMMLITMMYKMRVINDYDDNDN